MVNVNKMLSLIIWLSVLFVVFGGMGLFNASVIGAVLDYLGN